MKHISSVYYTHGIAGKPGDIEAWIGKYTYGAQNITVWFGDPTSHDYSVNGVGKLSIGAFCSLGDRITVWLGGNHRSDWVTTFPLGWLNGGVFNAFGGDGHGPKGHTSSHGNVTLGSDVWIGSDVTIMSGVTIGDGAVIANNSHVVKSVEPYCISGGNPAKTFKKRFPDESIDKLLKLKWWDKTDAEINEIAPLLCSTNLGALFAKFNL